MWVLLGRAMEYTADVIRKCIREKTDITMESCKQDATMQLVKYNMNCAAQYLYMFVVC
jgi:translation elongation factor EF-Ts